MFAVTCNENGRLISYSDPTDAAVDHYEARVYYGSGLAGSGTVFKESFGKITDNPYRFPEQPIYDPTEIGGDVDGDYSFVIRAYYADSSWAEDGCPFAPSSTLETTIGEPLFSIAFAATPSAPLTLPTGTFRHRHRAAN